MSGSNWRRTLLAGSALLVLAAPLAAQDLDGRVVVYGRIEDAVSREPVGDARVLAVDSSTVVYTDSLGAFGIPLPADGPLAVEAGRLGYLSQRFDLNEDAPERMSVLLLEPAPIAIEGITVEDEAALTELVNNLEARRNAYPRAMNAFDRSALDRFALGGSVSDFIERRVPRLEPCRSDAFRVCVPGRGRTIANPYPEMPVRLCIDGRPAVGFGEFESLPVHSVALVELYGGSIRPRRISVYTSRYMLSRARNERTTVTPYVMGC